MLINMEEMLKVADKNQFAVGAFNATESSLFRAVVEEAEAQNAPAIVQVAPGEFDFATRDFYQYVRARLSNSKVPFVLHLDHGKTIQQCMKAIQAGFTSVMLDGSELPYEENVAVTKKVVETAHIANVSVESELGTIGTTGNSIEGGTQGVIYTVPEEAKQFIEDTGIDTFAVAIGTAHGIYPKDMKPELRIDILKDITSKVDVPLVLHGGSSNKDEEIAAAVDNGICKINISSDIKVAFYTQCRKTLNENPGYREPLEIYPEAMEVCGKVVEEKIRLFKSNDKVKYYY